jgi:hypothetical protein
VYERQKAQQKDDHFLFLQLFHPRSNPKVVESTSNDSYTGVDHVLTTNSSELLWDPLEERVGDERMVVCDIDDGKMLLHVAGTERLVENALIFVTVVREAAGVADELRDAGDGKALENVVLVVGSGRLVLVDEAGEEEAVGEELELFVLVKLWVERREGITTSPKGGTKRKRTNLSRRGEEMSAPNGDNSKLPGALARAQVVDLEEGRLEVGETNTGKSPSSIFEVGGEVRRFEQARTNVSRPFRRPRFKLGFD